MEERLCGGTFFTLLSAVKRPNSRRSLSFMGIKGSLSEPTMLGALITILNPEYSRSDWDLPRSVVSKFKNCDYKTGVYLPFNDSAYSLAFHERVCHQYRETLESMTAFSKTFLQTEDKEKMDWLGRAVLELLMFDSTIPSDQALYISETGQPVYFRDIRDTEKICLPALLTGCWDYIVMNTPDNAVGRETIQNWLGEKDCVNSLGELKPEIGHRLQNDISVYMPETMCTDATEDRNKEAEMQENKSCYSAGSESVVIPASPGPSFPLYPQQTIPSQFFSGINVITSPGGYVGQISVYQMVGDEGTSIHELMGLDSTLYNLFVLDGDNLTGRSFSISKDCALNDYIQKEVRERFLSLTPVDQMTLTNIPSIFATVNRTERRTDPEHQALLGRITGIRLQHHDVRFQWKPYCMFPQQVLNQYESLFDIWTAPATNELSDEHWTIKQIPLLKRLQSVGVDPFRLTR